MYYPSNNNYNLCKLGAVILFHGGSYDECSDYRNPGIVKLCQAFAKRGFVAFSVEYRVGVLVDNRPVIGSIPQVTFTAAQQLLAVYRACQDARGAIRHIIENQSDKIDNSRIFLGGVSAGSVVAMATAYYQKQSRFNAVFPGIPTALGIVEQDFYELANPTYNFLPNIMGVFNCWGGLSLPYSSTYETNPYSFFNVSGFKKIPIISFAGKQDDIFNYKKQYMYFSSKNIFKNEVNCLINAPFSLPPFIDVDNPNMVTLGSQNIYEMFLSQGIPCELYLECNMMQGLDNCENCGGSTNEAYTKTLDNNGNVVCNPCLFDSKFGTTCTEDDCVYDYIAGRGQLFSKPL